jgi:hypothetical protein
MVLLATRCTSTFLRCFISRHFIDEQAALSDAKGEKEELVAAQKNVDRLNKEISATEEKAKTLEKAAADAEKRASVSSQISLRLPCLVYSHSFVP